MKPIFRLPVSAAALAAVFLLGIGLTRAQDDAQARRTAADGLLTAMHTEQTVDGSMTRMLTYVDRFAQTVGRQGATLTPAQSEAVQTAENDARDTIRKEFGYAMLKGDFTQIYADTFSEGELKDLTAFYNSPAGQKLVQKQAQLNEKMAQIAQQKARTVMPGVVQKLRETVQKNVPPAVATPPTVVTPMVSDAPVAPLPAAPATPGVPPTAATPPATTTPVPAVPTPLPSPAAATTPSAQ